MTTYGLADPLVLAAKASLAEASVMRRPFGPILGTVTNRLIDFERAGLVTAAQSNLALADLTLFVASLRSPSSTVKGLPMSNIDLPPEMTENSDGVPDAALHPEIIGCSLDALGVSGLPYYALTRKGLSNVTVRRRFAAALKKLPPKTRRRVLARLRAVVAQNTISGSARNVTAMVGEQGWGSLSVGGSRSCPYSQVAGPLTP